MGHWPVEALSSATFCCCCRLRRSSDNFTSPVKWDSMVSVGEDALRDGSSTLTTDVPSSTCKAQSNSNLFRVNPRNSWCLGANIPNTSLDTSDIGNPMWTVTSVDFSPHEALLMHWKLAGTSQEAETTTDGINRKIECENEVKGGLTSLIDVASSSHD